LKSGKQINENEFKRLADALPNEYVSPTDFKVRLKNFEKVFSEIITTRRKNLSGTGYRVPGNLKNPFDSSGADKPATHRWNPSTGKVELIQ